MNIIGQNITVFDCEIKNVIDGKIITWNDHAKMGISVAVTFNFKTMDYKVYLDDNMDELVDDLNASALITGFNIHGFDIPLIRACTKKEINAKSYDMLDESRYAMGYRPGGRFPSGLKLDDHLKGTFGEEHMKTEAGADAPVFWQQGKVGKVITYCLADVKREAKLFRHIADGKPVNTATHGVRLLRNPLELFK